MLPNVLSSSSDNYKEDRIFYLLVEKVLFDWKIHLIVSRNKNLLVEKLINHFCKEMKEDKISIYSIARHFGVKTKILVGSNNENYSSIFSLIGRGSSIVSIISKEFNEIVQIFEIIEDKIKETYINLMYLVDVENIKIDENSIHYYVKEKNLARAIVKGGINVKLTSMLIHKKVFVKVI